MATEDQEAALEMIDHAVEMVSGEVPAIEEEAGWTGDLLAEVRTALETAAETIRAGGHPEPGEITAPMDRAGVRDSSLREFVEMVAAEFES